jgi:F-type H+-transporting ATPase subunit gamma
MANRRLIVKRRKSVRNIRKITRTMQLIATARFQAAFNRATATKPFTQKLAELVSDLAGAVEGVTHSLMKPANEAAPAAVVVLTSERGLCGGYNANVLRKTIAHLDELKMQEVAADVHMSGKKGSNYFRFLGRPIKSRVPKVGDAPKFEQIDQIASGLIQQFKNGEVSAVYVVYMRFVSASKQVPEVLKLLPLSADSTAGEAPPPARNLEELLPATVRVRLFQCFVDAIVSEQIARMVAMKAATDAAGDMITSLTRQYNRARQTHITMELLDIVGGANALA